MADESLQPSASQANSAQTRLQVHVSQSTSVKYVLLPKTTFDTQWATTPVMQDMYQRPTLIGWSNQSFLIQILACHSTIS